MTKRGAGWSAVIGLVALLAGSNAAANTVNNGVTITGGTSFFGALHFDDMAFTDTFTFTISNSVLGEAASLIANLSLVTTGSGASNIDFVSADLNGVPVALSSPNSVTDLGFLGDTALTGPLVLTVRGTSGATGGTFASYSGTINVAVVPEPSTALLMGLGIGGLGLCARRIRV